MTPTLTAEQIGELEALLAKATGGKWIQDPVNKEMVCTNTSPYEYICDCGADSYESALSFLQEADNSAVIVALRNAALALIAMARHSLEMDEAAFADQGALTTAIGRAETAESRVKELEQACRHSSDWATCAIGDMKKAEAAATALTICCDSYAAENQQFHDRFTSAEAEVSTLLGRLKSAEFALDRAMARSNSWREEAAKLQAQMLGGRNAGGGAGFGMEYSTLPELMQAAPAETLRACATCMYSSLRFSEIPCDSCVSARSQHLPNWTPKPIPSTIDKGEGP